MKTFYSVLFAAQASALNLQGAGHGNPNPFAPEKKGNGNDIMQLTENAMQQLADHYQNGIYETDAANAAVQELVEFYNEMGDSDIALTEFGIKMIQLGEDLQNGNGLVDWWGDYTNAEEAEKKRMDEDAAKKRQEAAEKKKQEEEDAAEKKKQDEKEAAEKKQQEEEAEKKRQDEEAAEKKRQDEEAAELERQRIEAERIAAEAAAAAAAAAADLTKCHLNPPQSQRIYSSVLGNHDKSELDSLGWTPATNDRDQSLKFNLNGKGHAIKGVVVQNSEMFRYEYVTRMYVFYRTGNANWEMAGEFYTRVDPSARPGNREEIMFGYTVYGDEFMLKPSEWNQGIGMRAGLIKAEPGC